jgi:hypothetical protein
MKDFNEIRILDLGGDVRSNPKLSGTRHDVFGIQTGVAISFMLRKSGVRECKVLYARRPEFEDAESNALPGLFDVPLEQGHQLACV